MGSPWSLALRVPRARQRLQRHDQEPKGGLPEHWRREQHYRPRRLAQAEPVSQAHQGRAARVFCVGQADRPRTPRQGEEDETSKWAPSRRRPTRTSSEDSPLPRKPTRKSSRTCALPTSNGDKKCPRPSQNRRLFAYCEGIDDVCPMAGREEGREARRGGLEGRATFVEDVIVNL